jgi:hypothetical protein
MVVDACLGGVRRTGPPGVTLDLNFMAAGNMPAGIAFTRASTATYTDAAGTIQSAAVNTPRWDYDPVTHALRGVLIEGARINLLLNSAVAVTQSVAVTAQPYSVSFYGTGTITFSGAFAGTLVGIGTQRVVTTFTPTAGTLTCTVTGSVANAQIEAGAFASSYVPTTGAAATRAQDIATMPTNVSWYNGTTGTILAETLLPANGNNGYRAVFALDAGVSGQWLRAYTFAGLAQVNGDADAGAVVFGTMTPGTPFKIAANYSSAIRVAFNGAMGTGAPGVLASAPTYTTLRFGVTDSSNSNPMNGYIRRVQYWPRVLSDVEMQAVTR